MRPLKHLVTLFALLSLLECYGQAFFRHYSTNEGLPSSETYSVYQDSKGYIWIATDMGVSRFDGYNFKNYSTADGLVDNTIFNFYEDSVGRIWFHSFSGRLSYYYNGSIYGKDLQMNEHIRDFINNGYLTGIRSDSNDTLWLSTLKGLLKVTPSTVNGKRIWTRIEKLNTIATYPGSTKNTYTTLEPGKGKTMTLSIYNTMRLVSKSIIPDNYFHAINVVQFFDSSYILYCSDSSFVLNSKGQITGTINHTLAACSLREYDSLLWLGSKTQGTWLYHLNNLQQPLKHFLPGLTVSCVMRDKENGYWFTTTEDGLFYLSSEKLTHYTVGENLIPQAKITSITPLTVTNKIWAVAHKDVLVSSNNSPPELWPIKNAKIPKHYDTYYWNTFFYKPQELWVSTSSGIAIVNPTTGEFIQYIDMFEGEKGPEYDSRMLIADSYQNVWSLNLATLRKIDPIKRAVIKIIDIPARAQTICEDFNGNILVGTINGMYCYKTDSLYYMGNKNPIYKNRFVDIKKRNGVIVAATRGAGLFIMQGDSIYQLNPANGLSSSMCRSVYIDEKNMIWLATNSGLNVIKLRTNPFKATIAKLTIADGLLSNDIDIVTRSKDYIWLYSKKGLTVFNPDSVLHNTYAPPVYITRLTIDKEARPIKKTNELSYSTNFIGIDFIGLTYKNAGRQTYKYRLEGYDTSWAYTTNTFVQFTKLPPGEYKFLVKCINNSGVESVAPAVFEFTINTPFYLKWWFWFGLMLLAIGLVITGSFYTINRIRKREEHKTEINRKIANLELKALRAQMNPHFIFNCLNAIQDFIITNDSQSARRYLTSFAKLIRITLNNSRRQNIPLAEEVDFLRLYLELEHMRFNNKFDYTIELPGELKNNNIEIPSMILQPFVENAIRHGRVGHLEKQGKVTVAFALIQDDLMCIVEDNGIGFNQSIKRENQPGNKQAHALTIISDRVKTIGEINKADIRYTIEDKSDLSTAETGTIVKLYIPLKHID